MWQKLNVLLLKTSPFLKKNDHVIECTHTRGFVTDGLFEFVAQREYRFRLHCAIRVKNHYLFQGGNFWQFTD